MRGRGRAPTDGERRSFLGELEVVEEAKIRAAATVVALLSSSRETGVAESGGHQAAGQDVVVERGLLEDLDHGSAGLPAPEVEVADSQKGSGKSEDELFQEGLLDILKAAGSLARNELTKLVNQYEIRAGRQPDEDTAGWLLLEIETLAIDLGKREPAESDEDNPVAIRYILLLESMAAPWVGKSFERILEDIHRFVAMESDPKAQHQYMIQKVKDIEDEYSNLELGDD